MQFLDIPLEQLVVNPRNDRHGDQGSEQAAIDWLFTELGPKMTRLAEDIVSQGEIFDAPLVMLLDGKYFVFDGNRRVTCLKALAGLYDLPDPYAEKFRQLALDAKWSAPATLSCQIETRPEVVDEIVSRRHNGTDGGRGQLGWDPRAKANHANRVGATNQYPIAEAVENYLDHKGYPRARQIGRSTLYRLINAKKRQLQFGIELGSNKELKLTRDEESVMRGLTRVADDIVDKKLTLKNLLDLAGINKYMQDLLQEGFIGPPTESTRKKDKPNDKRPAGPAKQPKREYLIPQVGYDGLTWGARQAKIEAIWIELQFNLRLSKNLISITVLLRTLIEITTAYAIDNMRIETASKLSGRVKAVATELQNRGQIDRGELSDLVRTINDNSSTRDLEALHRAVHSHHFVAPGESDLIAIWSAFEKYLIVCIALR